MKTSPHLPPMPRMAVRLLLLAMASATVATGEPLEAIRKAAQEVVVEAEVEAASRKQDLAKKYAAALEGLEKKLSAAGDLDGVLHAREERAEVLKSGQTTAHAGKDLADLRGKYRKAVAEIDGTMAAARTKAAEQIRKDLRDRESALTKAGKIDEALALRKEGERILLEFGGGTGSGGFQEDPRIAPAGGGRKPLEPITPPAEKPPVMDGAFAQEDRWLESLTVPALKQRIRRPVVIGDRGKKAWPVVVVSPGSHWVGGGDAGFIEISAGNLVCEGSRFEDLSFYTDLACRGYFTRCVLEDCKLTRGGIWFDGSEHAGKFYFKECLVRGGTFTPRGINPGDSGYRAELCVFEDVELPVMRYGKKQPAEYLDRKWLRFVNCRFTDCKIPASFLYLTRDCVFENCTFTADPPPEKPGEEIIETPFEIVLYTTGCKNKIGPLPEAVTLTERPISALKGVALPTATELARSVAP